MARISSHFIAPFGSRRGAQRFVFLTAIIFLFFLALEKGLLVTRRLLEIDIVKKVKSVKWGHVAAKLLLQVFTFSPLPRYLSNVPNLECKQDRSDSGSFCWPACHELRVDECAF